MKDNVDQFPSPIQTEGDKQRNDQEASERKPFVKPRLTQEASLPEVTTGFFGTFSP